MENIPTENNTPETPEVEGDGHALKQDAIQQIRKIFAQLEKAGIDPSEIREDIVGESSSEQKEPYKYSPDFAYWLAERGMDFGEYPDRDSDAWIEAVDQFEKDEEELRDRLYGNEDFYNNLDTDSSSVQYDSWYDGTYLDDYGYKGLKDLEKEYFEKKKKEKIADIIDEGGIEEWLRGKNPGIEDVSEELGKYTLEELKKLENDFLLDKYRGFLNVGDATKAWLFSEEGAVLDEVISDADKYPVGRLKNLYRRLKIDREATHNKLFIMSGFREWFEANKGAKFPSSDKGRYSYEDLMNFKLEYLASLREE